MPQPTISLIISTYNWESALYLCLSSVLYQKVLPNEVIIADDGSCERTRDVVAFFQKKFPVPLHHVWQEDNGFQLAKIRNKAIKKAQFEYVIQVDGDLILDKNFIKDHLKFAKKEHFVRGSRTRMGISLSQKLLETKSIHFSLFNSDIKNRFNGFRNYYIAKLLATPQQNSRKMLGCNMAYWREDALKINGYENNLIGWGHEDEEFATRLINNSVYKIKMKHYGFVNHTYHPERARENEVAHNDLIQEVISSNKIKATNGINEL
jgi:glycosyltransferase involved in cell wall biosynthesis